MRWEFYILAKKLFYNSGTYTTVKIEFQRYDIYVIKKEGLVVFK